MPLSIQIHMFPKEFGVEVNERGNVVIAGLDRDTSSIAKIEINSADWKHIYKQLGRIKGVGIVRPEGLVVVTETENNNGDD